MINRIRKKLINKQTQKHLIAFGILYMLISIRSLVLTTHPYMGLTWEKLWGNDALQWFPFSIGVVAIIVFHELAHYIVARQLDTHPSFCVIWRWLLPCPAVKYDETTLTSRQEQLIFLAPQIITISLLISLFWLPLPLILSLVFTHLYMSTFDFAEAITGLQRSSPKGYRLALTVTYFPVIALLFYITLQAVLNPYMDDIWSFVVAGCVTLGIAVILLYSKYYPKVEKLSMLFFHIWWFLPLVIVIRLVKRKWINGFEISDDESKFTYVDKFTDIWRNLN